MSRQISRGVFIVANAAALFAASLAVEAQPTTRVYAVGILSIGAPGPSPERDVWIPFVEAMRELNYVEGRTLVVKRASAEGRAERLAGLAHDLVRAKWPSRSTRRGCRGRTATSATAAASTARCTPACASRRTRAGLPSRPPSCAGTPGTIPPGAGRARAARSGCGWPAP